MKTNETIREEQLKEIIFELKNYEDITEEIFYYFKINNLKDIPQEYYTKLINKIREMKRAREYLKTIKE